MQPRDHLGEVHYGVDANLGRRAVGGDPVGDDVDPPEALMLDGHLREPLGLDDDGGIDAAHLGQVLRPDRYPLLVGHTGHEEVASLWAAGLRERPEREHGRGAHPLVVRRAQPVEAVPLEPGDERLVGPVRVTDRVRVGVQAQRRPGLRAAQPGEHVGAARLDVHDLDLGSGVRQPVGDEPGDGPFPRTGGDEPWGHGLDADQLAYELDHIGGLYGHHYLLSTK